MKSLRDNYVIMEITDEKDSYIGIDANSWHYPYLTDNLNAAKIFMSKKEAFKKLLSISKMNIFKKSYSNNNIKVYKLEVSLQYEVE